MLTAARQRGVSLLEIMVTLVITGIVMAVAAPSFGAWIAGTRIRATAESMLAGMQRARSEATTRNTLVRFQQTDSLGADCLRNSAGANWVVDVVDANPNDSVEGKCNSVADGNTPPSIIQVRSATEVGNGVVVASDSSEVIFNGLGRQVPVSPATTVSAVTVDITSSSGPCAKAGGRITCLRVLVSPAGQIRMCNPAIPTGDPQAC